MILELLDAKKNPIAGMCRKAKDEDAYILCPGDYEEALCQARFNIDWKNNERMTLFLVDDGEVLDSRTISKEIATRKLPRKKKKGTEEFSGPQEYRLTFGIWIFGDRKNLTWKEQNRPCLTKEEIADLYPEVRV